MLKKIINNLTSWEHVNISNNHKLIVIGPEAKSQLKYFIKNYFYLDLYKNNIFNIKLIFPGIIYFLSIFLKKPFVLIKYLKFWPKLFFVISLIRFKKVEKLICLVDYNIWPKIIKDLLKEKINTISVQNSFRGYPVDRLSLTENFDQYFMWNDFNDNEKKIIKSELIDFGALKSYIVVNKHNLWSRMSRTPNCSYLSDRKLVLISSFSSIHAKFFDKYLKNIEVKNFLEILVDLERKCLTNRFFGKIKPISERKKFTKRLYFYQCIEFFKMCILIREYIQNNRIKLDIIERNTPDNEHYYTEEIYFKKTFGQDLMLKYNVYDKIKYIVKNVNSVFITNISNLGRESLALNRKSFFFSSLLHYYNPEFFENSSEFFCLSESKLKFQKLLNNLFEMDSSKFLKTRLELKKTVTSFFVTKEKFENFLKITGLKTN